MGHNRSYKPEDIRFPDQVITESNLVDEMEKSYIEYAMSVIVGRAPPDFVHHVRKRPDLRQAFQKVGDLRR